MSSKDYVKNAVENVLKSAKDKHDVQITGRVQTPMRPDYYPELDESDELDTDGVTFFQEIIGILRWARTC